MVFINLVHFISNYLDFIAFNFLIVIQLPVLDITVAVATCFLLVGFVLFGGLFLFV